MKTLKKLYEELVQSQPPDNGIDPQAQASANALLLMDKLKNNPSFVQMLDKIYLPSDKYKAIKKFGDLLGIPEDRFYDFITQQQNQGN
jgi:hypothetical protein